MCIFYTFTIWRALSKPPQIRHVPDPRPLWLLVWTPSAFELELAYRLRVEHPTLMDVPIYFWYTIILLYMFVYHNFMNSLLWFAVVPQSLKCTFDKLICNIHTLKSVNSTFAICKIFAVKCKIMVYNLFSVNLKLHCKIYFFVCKICHFW